ncbi:class II aldolase/adducin family protein [Phyllobacterium sp. 0TCS1.6C]|jgi:L-fuculose-phosphate aldolase|uniref:class II aldolase/adducin family protein n=1 Tax=unclassified Phyllobacterium TaxID=2638441 RepID=UPI002264FA67|nr:MULTISPECIES: class II aldolase/adducin family protein [unclassified Phyllobacterium]MCX8279149.1 class II aldolase/adducin family protein [Phyllobacterium sp. 0TCS1.6C]MCX8293933.1 class II aldolase/adducin family protein [Phyllobacterium sp. 0TCS1.6A]
MTTESEKRNDLAETYRELDKSGLIFLASGNISVRHENGMLISPTGASADKISPDSFIFCDFDGTCPGGGKPSSEWSMHAAIYASAPSTQAVVHTHSDNCVAVSCTNKPLPPFHYMIAAFGGEDVRCTPYVTYGSPELGQAAVEALEGRNSCLLGNHGMISHGTSLRKAYNLALRLEILCRQYIQARQAGEVVMMQPREIEIAIERYKTYGLS